MDNTSDSSNWQLCPQVFRALMQIRGPCTKDLFADRLNAQLPQFSSWRPHPKAIASDALQKDWSHEKSYAFPPFCLKMRSLAKLRAQGAELILVTHLWPTQAWYTNGNLLDLSVSLPVLLPMSTSLLPGPRGWDTPFDCEPDSSIGRLACIKRSSQSEGIRTDASKRILAARHKRRLQLRLEKWHGWCLGREIDPFRHSLSDTTSFLADSFNKDQNIRHRIHIAPHYQASFPLLTVFPSTNTHWSFDCSLYGEVAKLTFYFST